MSDKTPRGDVTEQVMAPGGPRPATDLRSVLPGQTVRRTGLDFEVADGQDEPVGDVVAIPGGYRRTTDLHAVAAGAVVDASDGVLRLLGADGEELAHLGVLATHPAEGPAMPRNVVTRTAVQRPVVAADEPGALGSGWITYADWTNSTGTPITQFTTIWQVPPEPETRSGQLLYLFNGMQNSTHIFQPVLQWGRSPAGGGDFWSVATWFVGPPGTPAFHSDGVVRVSPGDSLIGVMTLTGQGPGGSSYSGGFFGVGGASWSVSNIPELTWMVETLEAYGVTQAGDYPPVTRTTMYGIDLKQGSARPPLAWRVNAMVTDTGQHTVVHDSSPDGGSLDLCYHPGPSVDDIVLWNQDKAYLFNGSTYVRYDVAADRADAGYPAPIRPNWRNLPERFGSRLDAVVKWPNGKAYLFKGSRYARYDVAADRMDDGYPLRIGGHWPGFPAAFEASVDAGVVWPNGKAYFFKGNQYIRYDVAADRADPGYPLPIAGNWPGLPPAFQRGIDAIVVWPNGKAYIFRRDQYCRYDVAADRVDPGYPLLTKGNWPGLPPAYVAG
jgi:hypothetical protein